MNGRKALRRLLWLRWAGAGIVLLAVAGCTGWMSDAARVPQPQRFSNPYVVPEDTGARVPETYLLRRAWVQITRDLTQTEIPPSV